MPRRAILSAAFILFGTLPGFAALLNPAARNTSYQPGAALRAAIIRPAQARILGGEQRISGIKIRKITPIGQTPAQLKLNHVAFTQPASAVMRPTVSKAAGGN